MKELTIIVPYFKKWGTEHSIKKLIEGFINEGYYIKFVIPFDKFDNNIEQYINNEIDIYKLNVPNVRFKYQLFHIFIKLVQYFKINKPSYVLCPYTEMVFNSIVLLALKGSRVKSNIFLNYRLTPSYQIKNATFLRRLLYKFCIRYIYKYSDGIIANSKGVKKELQQLMKNGNNVYQIYNPIVNNNLSKLADKPIDHPWFNTESYPLILTIGRLEKEKNLSLLIEAFNKVRNEFKANLLIIGDGAQKKHLTSLIRTKNLTNSVDLIGYVANPYPYLKRASLFVLTSEWESLGNVLIEALYFQIPIVSTDCKYGPREILADGRYGKLVPINDIEKMKDALLFSLYNYKKNPVSYDYLAKFSQEHIVKQYLSLIDGNNIRYKNYNL